MRDQHTPYQELFYDDSRAALFEDGQLVDYWPSDTQSPYGIGAIHYARVTQLFAKQNRANCQLDTGEIASVRFSAKDKLTAGQLCWITLSAMPRQHKPWQAELGISRAGRLIVMHYGQDTLRVSHKAKEAIDDALLRTLKAALPDGWGAVLKRASLDASTDDIIAEMTRLVSALPDPLPDVRHHNQPFCFYHGETGRDYVTLGALANHERRRLDDAVRWDEISAEAKLACEQVVSLSNGAVLTVEQTQAVLAIDVDSAQSRLSPLALARAVAPHIMRLIRLAHYSGVIVIDMPRLGFSDMTAILAEMRHHATRDIRHPDVLGVSRAGLIEIVVRHRLSRLSERMT